MNPVAATGFGSSMLLKGLISSAIVIALVLLKRGRLLKPLNLGMLVVVLWNGFAIPANCEASRSTSFRNINISDVAETDLRKRAGGMV